MASELLTTLLWQLTREDVGPDRPRLTLDRARQVVIEHLEDPRLDVPFLARELGVSTRTVHAAFADVQLSAAEFIRRQRLDRASAHLLASPRPIIEIATAVGFSEITTFTRSFKRRFGVTPGQWRRSPSAGRTVA
jgi:AraC-like DNA-binding protein